MPEDTTPQLKEQIKSVNKLLDKGPLVVYLTATISIISVGLAAHFVQPSEPLWTASLSIAVFCTGFGTLWAINAKREYKKLVEQLNSKS